MSKLIWILRAAMHMLGMFHWWKPRDLLFCWETAAVIWGNHEYDKTTPGDPEEEIREELSCWSD